MSTLKGKFDIENIRKLIVAISLLTIGISLIILIASGRGGSILWQDDNQKFEINFGDTLRNVQEINQLSDKELDKIDHNKLEKYLDQKKQDAEQDISVLELYLSETDLSEELYATNDSLLNIRNKERRKAENLAKKIRSFKVMPPEQKKQLLKDISGFIASLADKTDAKEEEVLSEVVSAILAENKVLKLELKRLKGTTQKLRQSLAKFKDIEQNLFAIQQKYYKAIDQINKLEIALRSEKGKGKTLKNQITSLEEMASDLKKLVEEERRTAQTLQQEINSSTKVRVSALAFEPSNARKKANGDYALWQVNKIKLDFKLVSNNPKYERNKNYKIKIKIYQPNPNRKLAKKPLLTVLNLSMPIGVTYSNEFPVGVEGKKGKGLYLVQVYLEGGAEEKLLDWASFTTRKYLGADNFKS